MNIYLVIYNISKYNNVRSLLLTATAFGCHEVLMVGQHRNLQRGGMIPSSFEQAKQEGIIRLRHFSKWKECLEYMREQSILLIGVEIDDRSQVLDEEYFVKNKELFQKNKSVAIFMGNEGQGIHPKHLQECQELVRIPQYGVGTASLNVNVAANIVLYRFHQWKQSLEH